MTRGYRFANALATKIAGRFSASRLRTKSDRLLAEEIWGEGANKSHFVFVSEAMGGQSDQEHSDVRDSGMVSDAGKATVDRYRKRSKGPPSQTWRSFLGNEAKAISGIDCFTLPTASFRILYVFIVLMHSKRRVVHFNVTEHPYCERIIGSIRRDCVDHVIIFSESHLQRILESIGVVNVLISARE